MRGRKQYGLSVASSQIRKNKINARERWMAFSRLQAKIKWTKSMRWKRMLTWCLLPQSSMSQTFRPEVNKKNLTNQRQGCCVPLYMHLSSASLSLLPVTVCSQDLLAIYRKSQTRGGQMVLHQCTMFSLFSAWFKSGCIWLTSSFSLGENKQAEPKLPDKNQVQRSGLLPPFIAKRGGFLRRLGQWKALLPLHLHNTKQIEKAKNV